VTALWFRRDLRVPDSSLLAHASGAVLPVFIFDPALIEHLPEDDKRVAHIQNAVAKLKADLKATGLDLAILSGDPVAIFVQLKAQGVTQIFAAPDYDPYARKRDRAVASVLPLHLINDCYLYDPDEIRTQSGGFYRVFTPFYRRSLAILCPGHSDKRVRSDTLTLAEYDYGPDRPYTPIDDPLPRLESIIPDYPTARDFSALEATGHLSTALRFGTTGIRQVARHLKALQEAGHKVAPLWRQLIWREFYAQLLFHHPLSASEDLTPLNIEWNEPDGKFRQWQAGQTGFPIIDAAMRQLLQTGWMPNRARMVTASFLCKDLLIHWTHGEAHFARYLMDYDAAQNVGGWQWAAGTGADAQPFVRIFNPWLQSKRYDPDGTYIRRWVPELAHLEAKVLHDPARLAELKPPGYPDPIINHARAARRAQQLFKERKR
jgi:deoxyribodipyrimidine photo-lyase